MRFDYHAHDNELDSILLNLDAFANHPLLKNNYQRMRKELAEKMADSTLKIAVCGQYSAGKSTLIKALTGRDDIKTGQDITTDSVTEYRWNGISLADTPGILAGREDHDEKSLEAIKCADLLIYMITVQGFDSIVGANFRNLIFDKNYLEKTMLVMNKRSMESAENEPFWIKDIEKFFGDSSFIARLRLCIIDAEDYILGVREHEDELIADSRVLCFIDKLNDFVAKKGLMGKLVSRANIIDAFVTVSTANMEIQDKGDEFSRRLKVSVKSAIDEYNRIIRDNASAMRHNVINLGNKLVGLLQEDSMNKFQEMQANVEFDLKEILKGDQLQKDICDLSNRISDEIESINTDAESYQRRLTDIISINLSTDISKQLDFSSFDKGAQMLGSGLQSVSKDTIVSIAHFFGHKFAPWGATKWLDGLQGVSKAIPLISGLLILGQFVWDRKRSSEIEQARIGLRATFKEIADGVDDGLIEMKNSESSLYSQLIKTLEELNQKETERTLINSQKEELSKQLLEVKELLATFFSQVKTN